MTSNVQVANLQVGRLLSLPAEILDIVFKYVTKPVLTIQSRFRGYRSRFNRVADPGPLGRFQRFESNLLAKLNVNRRRRIPQSASAFGAGSNNDTWTGALF